jgi:glycosyltransferase involved in cell wall biosynthesis
MTHGPTQKETFPSRRIGASAGIIACNEEEALGPMLESVFRQNLFSRLEASGQACEIIVLANGCTDRTAEVAREILEHQSRHHAHRTAFVWRVLELTQRGKLNAWNEFVHRHSAKEAEFLFLLDGDILLEHPDTLWSMQSTLESNSRACISTDQPLKDIAVKERKSWKDRISLSTTQMNRTGKAQLTGQLYCIRAPIARNIYLPKDLVACEDGFIKSLACSFFLTREPSPERIVQAPNASHIFEAYVSLPEILRNQKRQMIGQTVVHILVDDYLRNLPLEQRLNFAETVQNKENYDPEWLKRLIAAHLKRVKYFWRLFPGLLTFRFERLAALQGFKKIVHFPSALAGFAMTMTAAWQAWRFLKAGSTHFWPDTRSRNLRNHKVPNSGSSAKMAGTA